MNAIVAGGGTDPWPFSLTTESASALLNGMMVGKRVLVLDPANPMAPANFDPERIQITVDSNRKIVSVKIG